MMLEEDEELSPTFEELILANVLGLIDSRLPGYKGPLVLPPQD
jgi:hypothetical protein